MLTKNLPSEWFFDAQFIPDAENEGKFEQYYMEVLNAQLIAYTESFAE